mmetsp:Transcript_16776/g.38757  ORF Transcript_16776/g.38757 Transcript_16776/m.38757 type:complete len:206 (+) Transcript_16776:414-1031(+)
MQLIQQMRVFLHSFQDIYICRKENVHHLFIGDALTFSPMMPICEFNLCIESVDLLRNNRIRMDDPFDISLKDFARLDFSCSFSRCRRTVFERQVVAQTLGYFFSDEICTAFDPPVSSFVVNFFHEPSVRLVYMADNFSYDSCFQRPVRSFGILFLSQRYQSTIKLISRMIPICSSTSTNNIILQRLFSCCWTDCYRWRLRYLFFF